MNLGMGRVQIDELAKTRQLTQEIVINAPVTGFILTRNITPGQKFTSGEELFRLADLSRVWVVADLFRNEANFIRPGEKVKVSLPNQNEKHVATVSEVLPEFNPTTLSLKVRLDLENPIFTFRPGMFTDVEFPIHLPPSINVPVDAVMDSGLKQTVFVDRGHGFFEPRQVKTGWRLGDRVEILEGLKPGERLVISGNFLIDSESRMKLAAAGMFGEVTTDPVCGLNVDESKAKAAGLQSTFNDQTFYFCSPGCQQHFDRSPERYAGKKAEVMGSGAKTEEPEPSPKPAESDSALDLVCEQEVSQSQAKVKGHTSDYDGKIYYFTSYACKHAFDKDPQRYIKEAAAKEGERAAATRILDPVCGLSVAAETAIREGRTSEYQGKTYYFDTIGCKQRFDNDPQRYLSASPEGPLPKKYPDVPTDPDLLLRLRREFLRALPTWKTQELPPGPIQMAPEPAPQSAPQVAPQETPQDHCPAEQHGEDPGAAARPKPTRVSSGLGAAAGAPSSTTAASDSAS